MPEAREAEAVAARLKAFQAHPQRMARLYTEGIEPLPEGAIVLRFAQGRIPASLAPSAFEAHQLRSAAELFVRRVCLWERADHYQVLCAPRDAGSEILKGNYHLLMGLLHPDRQEGAADPWPEECAQRVNLAYATLGDESARREYDGRTQPRQPRRPAPAAAAPREVEGSRDVRFAKSLIIVSVIVGAVVAASLMLHDDEWSDRSVLQASLARLRIAPAPGADRPRYVGASALAPAQRATDATVGDDSPALSILRPLMRVFSSDEPKPYVPVAQVEPVSIPAAQPLIVAQAPLPVAQAVVPAPSPRVQVQASAPVPAPGGPSNADIENLVVALVSSYEAGDSGRLVDLVDSDSVGFFARNRMRNAYDEFFRGTRSRQLRIDRLAWTAAPGGANAQGEATVRAEYADRAPFEKHVDVQLGIVVRDGRARLARMNLFPIAP